MERFARLRQRMAILTAVGAPPIFAVLENAVAMGVSGSAAAIDSQPLLPTAGGDMDFSIDWISWPARAQAAMYVADIWAQRTNSPDEARLARVAAEVGCNWSVPTLLRAECQHKAARMCVQYLMAHPQDIAQAMRKLLQKLQPRAMYENKRVLSYCVPGHPEGVVVSRQRDTFYAAFGPSVPHSLFVAASRNQLVQLCQYRAEDTYVAVEPGTIALESNAAEVLQALDDGDIIALVEFMARANAETCGSVLLAAAFVCVTSLCKGGNITAHWLARCLRSYMVTTGVAQVEEYINIDVFQKFKRLYPCVQVGVDRAITQLFTISFALRDQNFDYVAWIIEQATTFNISPLRALAEVVTTTPHLGLHVVFKQAPFEDQLQHLARAAAAALRDPLGSAIQQSAPWQGYANWAYLGLMLKEIQTQRSGGRVLRFMSSNVRSFTTTSPAVIDQLANRMTDRATYALEATSKVREEATQRFGGPVHQTGLFNIPRADIDVPFTDRAEGDDPQSVQVVEEGNERRMHTVEEAGQMDLAQCRANWPKKYQTLPPQAFRIGIAQLLEHLSATEPDQVKALKRVLGCVHASSIQAALKTQTRPGGDKNTLPARYKAIPADVRASLIQLGLPEDEVNAMGHVTGIHKGIRYGTFITRVATQVADVDIPAGAKYFLPDGPRGEAPEQSAPDVDGPVQQPPHDDGAVGGHEA